MKLGSLVLKSRVILSPLEGVSDVAFRSLCGELGAAMTWTEMVRAQGVARSNAATLRLIDTFSTNTPTGLQLMATSTRDLQQALDQIEHLATTSPNHQHFHNIQAVDLNFGCPSKSIINIGGGPAMLKRRQRLGEMFETLLFWKRTSKLACSVKAVGCKIRLGLNAVEQGRKIYLQVAEIANECGLDYITVHGRHAQQHSSSPASWAEIKEVKDMSAIPVIGNGDVWNKEDMMRMIDQTNCDGVMVARAAIKNPWVFRELCAVGVDASSNLSAWPTAEEVEKAMADYKFSAEQHETNVKYAKFNIHNLGRIYEAVKSNKTTIDYMGPNTIHFT